VVAALPGGLDAAVGRLRRQELLCAPTTGRCSADRLPVVRAEDWDERYAEDRQWSPAPNRLVADLLDGLPPGDGVDLAAGEGRHALWLAGLGWRVTAVDFAATGLARGRAQSGADAVTWVQADVLDWTAPPESLDLVLVAYLHVPAPDLRTLLDRAVGWLRPRGRLLVLGHDVANLTAGVGGPQDPAILHSVDRLRPVADGLEVDRLEQVRRESPAGTALDTLLWARRPARGVAPRR
jgi:SAM-dependent methyltransferase